MLQAAVMICVESVVRSLAGLGFALILILTARRFRAVKGDPTNPLRLVLTVLAIGWIVVMIMLFINHIRFPLFLDLMEGTVFQHFQRAASFQTIYPEPSPEYAPLAYNVLYYIVCVPFSWVFGESLFTMRLISILSTVGIGALIFWILLRETNSKWWGLVGAGIFAASYQGMNCYLDTAHSDASLVFCALAGSAVICYSRSRGLRLFGLAILIASFWFKQHGVLFAIGGLAYLTWDEGLRKSWPYWILTAVLGPLTYIGLGPKLFGSHFLYFTYTVPAGWTTLSLRSFVRIPQLLIQWFFWPALGAVWWSLTEFRQRAPKSTIWQVQLIAAIGTAVMGSLDADSSNNVYIPLFSWLTLIGVWGFARLEALPARQKGTLIAVTMVTLTFALVSFNPMAVLKPRDAQKSYRAFIQFLNSLDGFVYAPTLGQLPSDYTFYPAAHWVAIEDMIRGPGKDMSNNPLVKELLAPLLNSDQTIYILENHPLAQFRWLEYLNDYFVLEEDLQNRFEPLRVLPGRWDHGWPRYLYRFDPRGTASEANISDDAPTTTSQPQIPSKTDRG